MKVKRVEYVAGYLPVKLRDAVITAAKFCRAEVSEIHIIKGSGSSVRLLSRNIYLGVTVSERDLEEIVSAITLKTYLKKINVSMSCMLFFSVITVISS